jgi:hypothetical protein
MPDIEYLNTAHLSNFEMEMIHKFRAIRTHGYGRLEVVIHNGRIVKFDPHPHYEQEKLLAFSEAQ